MREESERKRDKERYTEKESVWERERGERQLVAVLIHRNIYISGEILLDEYN